MARVSPSNTAQLIETIPLTGGTFSAELVPQIASLLEKHSFTKDDLAGFAVVSGPGSFTGLRVGLAAIKGLAEALRKPIAAISLLEVIARNGKIEGRLCAALDAGRNEVYVGDYEVSAEIRTFSERLLQREDFLAEAKHALVVTPDPALADSARQAGCRVQEIEYPQAGVIARIGWERIRRGEIVRPEDLEANYIRRSDAEIFSKPRT